MALSARALEFLRDAGWTEDRRLEMDSVERELSERGYVLVPPARVFLERYCWLLWLRKSPFHGSEIAIAIDPLEIGGRFSVHEVRRHEQSVGAKLTPLGTAGYGFFWMLMDEHGRVFAADEARQLDEWADSGEKLIEKLVLDHGPPPSMPPWPRSPFEA
jgi:hypothetical protein